MDKVRDFGTHRLPRMLIIIPETIVRFVLLKFGHSPHRWFVSTLPKGHWHMEVMLLWWQVGVTGQAPDVEPEQVALLGRHTDPL